MARNEWTTKRASKNIDTLLAQCEALYDYAMVVRHQQGEAWATKALREAKSARASFDDGQFEYVRQAFEAAYFAKGKAREYI
jgi:hypothetical protein